MTVCLHGERLQDPLSGSSLPHGRHAQDGSGVEGFTNGVPAEPAVESDGSAKTCG